MKETNMTHRVVTFLTREELEFLDKLEKDMMFSTGTRVSRSKIIEGLVDLLAKTHMDANGIKNSQQLEEKIAQSIAAQSIAGMEQKNSKEV